MPNVFSRNVTDKAVNPVPFALPASASTSTNSTTFDLQTPREGSCRPENFELSLIVPALSATIVPNASTVTYIVESSSASNFSPIYQTLLSEVQTGAGGVGVAAVDYRCAVPNDCARYIRFRVAFGASTTTGAAVLATGSVKF
jgi:hypothetical protein